MRFTSTSTGRKAPEIDRATSSDEARPVLSCAYLNVEESTIEATDSYMAVVLPVEIEEGDTSGLIPTEAIKAYRKANGKGRQLFGLTANGDVTLSTPDGDQTWKRPDGQFPNLRQLMPTEYSGFRIGIDAEKLHNLAKALGADGQVTIEFALERDTVEEGEGSGFFPSKLRPMRVTGNGNGDAWGILMPVRVP